jgi:hypothetical protein
MHMNDWACLNLFKAEGIWLLMDDSAQWIFNP